MHRSPLGWTRLMSCASPDLCAHDTWMLRTLLARTRPCSRAPCPDAMLPHALARTTRVRTLVTRTLALPCAPSLDVSRPADCRRRAPIPQTLTGHTRVAWTADNAACPWLGRGQMRRVSLVRASLPWSCYLSHTPALFHVAHVTHEQGSVRPPRPASRHVARSDTPRAR